MDTKKKKKKQYKSEANSDRTGARNLTVWFFQNQLSPTARQDIL